MIKPVGWSIPDPIVSRIKVEAAAIYLRPTQLVTQILREWLDRKHPAQVDPMIALEQAHDELHQRIKDAYPLGHEQRKVLLQASRQLRDLL